MASIEEVAFHKLLDAFERLEGNNRALKVYGILEEYREKVVVVTKHQTAQECIDKLQDIRDLRL